MKGGIYSDEKCPVCGSRFKDVGNSLSCPIHKDIKTTKLKMKFGGITKRYNSYSKAFRTLTGLRFKSDEKTFDERDYKRDNPLGFSNVSEKYIEHKEGLKSHKDIANHIRHAQRYFGNINIKDVRYGHFEDFLKQLTCSGKTKHNIMSDIHSMFVWLKRRQMIHDLPEFPVVKFDLGYRKTVSKETQIAIIEEVKRICPNPKVYLGIKWLSTYISIRPAEMINLRESEIDLANKYLYFPHPKEKKFKTVPILTEDIDLIKSFSLSFPAMPFFRHEGGIKGTVKDQAFGLKYFYKWWKKACQNLGIEGIDLYGGTRHSSVRALRAYRTPEEIKKATMSATNKAFERYYGQADDEQIRDIYTDTGKVIQFDPVLTLKNKVKTGSQN